MLLSTITFIMMMAIYPLSLLNTASPASERLSTGLRILASTQLISAAFGFVLSFAYTQFSWYAALTGLYQVDTYSGLKNEDKSTKKL